MPDLTDRLFKYAKIDRASVRPKKVIPKHFDNLVAPLGLRLNQEEKKMSPGFITSLQQVSAERATGYTFSPFPEHELVNNLHLQPPRKVNAYAASQRTLNKQAQDASGGPKPKVKREGGGGRGGKGNAAWLVSGGMQGKIKRQHQQDENAHFVEDEDESMLAMPRGNLRTADGTNVADLGEAEQVLSSATIVLPNNFFPTINDVFEHFWGMEFTDPTVSQAFFANIDGLNCVQYGLNDFADSAMSLSIIRDRINATAHGETGRSRAYRSPEDFYSDFRQMFENIFAYFPENSAPKLKAVELNAIFHDKWGAATKAFVYPK